MADKSKNNPDCIVHHLSWMSSIPVGSKIYRGDLALTVLSAGFDFLYLKNETDGSIKRITRNSPETLDYSVAPLRR